MTIPDFTSEDIEWVCRALGLPADAFNGDPGHDHGLDILRLQETADIAACPGSGKTTLLVAKLAIIARHWRVPHHGVCVLSHTNVARDEIAIRLAGTGEGQALLAYPHYVGTIQGFIDEFLAMPWLRSLGYKIRAVDDARCEQHRRRLLRQRQFAALATYVRRNEERIPGVIVANWVLASPDGTIVKSNGDPEFVNDGPAAQQLVALGRNCARDGYFRYREMFMWAGDLLAKCPEARSAIRCRFPYLFVDEVQDNSEEQSALLHNLFMNGDGASTRQRFGDANQAIYSGDSPPATDVFPNAALQRTIANSHRFGQVIADLAAPLAVEPQDLVGQGPNDDRFPAVTGHTIFLFDDDAKDHVLKEYGDLLIDQFGVDGCKIGTFTAVGAVHRPSDRLNVGHYWPRYNHSTGGSSPQPATLIECLWVGFGLAEESGDSFHVSHALAGGLIRAARLVNPTADIPMGRRPHFLVTQFLNEKRDALAAYRRLVTMWQVRFEAPTNANWHGEHRQVAIDVIEALAGTSVTADVSEFLGWPTAAEEPPAADTARENNIFRHPADDPRVNIRVGSIHSVKGETHTATLVLDVEWNGSYWANLKPWLLGDKRGKGREGVRNQKRLREHYVAMTRPTHLVCIAMARTHLSATDIDRLKRRGWRVRAITAQGATWV